MPWMNPHCWDRLNRATMDALAELDARGEELSQESLGRILGIMPKSATQRLYMARKAGLTDRVMRRRPRQRKTPARPPRIIISGNPANHRGVEKVDPAEIVAVLQDCYRGMRDGRAEVDEAPFGHPPRSGMIHRVRAESRAEACRRMLREWRRIVRREAPEVEPRPGHGRAARVMMASRSAPPSHHVAFRQVVHHSDYRH